jgi:hypothetical protein
MVEMAKDSLGHLCSENKNNYPHLDLQRIDYNHGCAKLVLVEAAIRVRAAYANYCTTDGLDDNLTTDAMVMYLSDGPVEVSHNVYSTIKGIRDHGKRLDVAEVSQFLQSRGFCTLSNSDYEASSAANEYPDPFYGIEEIYGDPSTNHLDDPL